MDLAELYRDLHANPELAFQETRTAGIVAARLGALGFAVTAGIGAPAWSGSCATAPGRP
jgi:hippurate hydrolase